MTFIIHLAATQLEAFISTLPTNAIVGIGLAATGIPIGLLWAIIDETRESLRKPFRW